MDNREWCRMTAYEQQGMVQNTVKVIYLTYFMHDFSFERYNEGPYLRYPVWAGTPVAGLAVP
jgi:hypothetical protein